MSYTKTNWNTGDIISAEKLNKMEDGIAEFGGEMLIVNSTDDGNGTYVLDKTFQEIYDAVDADKVVVVKREIDAGYTMTMMWLINSDPHMSPAYRLEAGGEFTAVSADDYPTLTVGEGVIDG